MATSTSSPGLSSAAAIPGNPFAVLPPVPVLDNTFGALLVGTFVSLIQFGWTLHQCYQYFRVYDKDSWLFKCMVWLVLLLETLHSIISMHACYFYLTTNYFNPLALAESVWSINLLGVVTGTVILVSQLFFLRRLLIFGHKCLRPLVAICGLLLLAEFALATGVTVIMFQNRTLHNDIEARINTIGVGVAALADTLITAGLIFSLHQSRTGIKQTDGLIDLLILYAIETGLLTGIFNTLSFIFALAMPDNLIYVAVDIVATKLYANSLMAALNSRKSLGAQRGGQQWDVGYISPSGTKLGFRSQASQNATGQQHSIRVQMTRNTSPGSMSESSMDHEKYETISMV